MLEKSQAVREKNKACLRKNKSSYFALWLVKMTLRLNLRHFGPFEAYFLNTFGAFLESDRLFVLVLYYCIGTRDRN